MACSCCVYALPVPVRSCSLPLFLSFFAPSRSLSRSPSATNKPPRPARLGQAEGFGPIPDGTRTLWPNGTACNAKTSCPHHAPDCSMAGTSIRPACLRSLPTLSPQCCSPHHAARRVVLTSCVRGGVCPNWRFRRLSARALHQLEPDGRGAGGWPSSDSRLLLPGGRELAISPSHGPRNREPV